MKAAASDLPGRSTVTKCLAFLVLFVAMETAALPFTRANIAAPAGTASALNATAPRGVRILAQLPLSGPPASRMYTQWEHGKTYLYVEQGPQQITTVDITRKKSPHIVDHRPAKPGPTVFEELGEEESIAAVPLRSVIPGVDNVNDPGTLSVLQTGDPQDQQLLRAFGHDSSNLVDRDRHLVFFASPTRLLIVEDARWSGVDYVTN